MNAEVGPEPNARINLSMSPGDKEDAVTLSKSDVALIRNALGQGLGGYARQGDIVELHKRIGEKFSRLPEELGTAMELSSGTRLDALDRRIGALEESLNGLEGALRIELAPFLGDTVEAAVKRHAPPGPRRGRALMAIALLCAGLTAGVILHAPISDAAHEIAGGFAAAGTFEQE